MLAAVFLLEPKWKFAAAYLLAENFLQISVALFKVTNEKKIYIYVRIDF